MTGGILQVTLLVTISHLMVIASGNCATGSGFSGLFQNDGRNTITCNKTDKQLKNERKFVKKEGP